MEIKDRIMQFIDYKGITKNKFEVLCGGQVIRTQGGQQGFRPLP